ncbi:unnamed protein product, partial [Prunus brigantina]
MWSLSLLLLWPCPLPLLLPYLLPCSQGFCVLPYLPHRASVFCFCVLPYILPCSQGVCVLPYLLPCSQGFCVLLCALFFRVCSCVSAVNFALVCHLFHSCLTKRPSL